MESQQPFAEAIRTIHSFLPDNLKTPLFGIVCGTGLSGLADSLRDVITIPYDKIPGFAVSTGLFLLQLSLALKLTVFRCSLRA
jgi:purine nucleoside phosphorylase